MLNVQTMSDTVTNMANFFSILNRTTTLDMASIECLNDETRATTSLAQRNELMESKQFWHGMKCLGVEKTANGTNKNNQQTKRKTRNRENHINSMTMEGEAAAHVSRNEVEVEASHLFNYNLHLK